jgi:amino acid adenylation domain-containing protein
MGELSAGIKGVEVDYDPFANAELARAVPTTEAQREIWLADQLGREASLAYNEAVSLQLQGALKVDVLQNALLALADRHEALRSTISSDGLSLMIAPRGALVAELVDLTSHSQSGREAALQRLREQAVLTPFNLTLGPLLRAQLVALAPAQHELLLTGHHIVCDGWSFGVLATELMALYKAMASGARAEDSLPFAGSFGDYALAQASGAQLQAAQADIHWWVAQYQALPAPLELPTDRPRRAQRSFDALREDLLLEPALVEAVRQFGARHGASLFASLFAGWAALLARLSGQDDLVVGVPAAGQASEGQTHLVGHCVQLLPIRLAVDLEQPFTELLGAVRGRVLDAYEHQACTYGQLLQKLQLPRDPSRLPLVATLFNLDQALRSEDLSPPGLQVQLQGLARRYENFDLFLNASQIDGAVQLECQYNTALFDAATVRRWLALYREALQRLTAGAAQTGVQALAPTAEDQALLQRFNATATEFPRSLRIDRQIERQAAATPTAIAIVAGKKHLTYRQLDERANALAITLQERGVKPGDLVGLSCGRNEHMLVGLLGILKSGAGYVPMDPAFPAERLETMSSDAHTRCIVSDNAAGPEWKFRHAERVQLDGMGASSHGPERRSDSMDDPAYVIYTSGSTGKPKGVRVPHRSVSNLLQSVRHEPGLDAARVVLSVTTLSFDIAVSEVILPLVAGARIVIADRAQATDGDRLRELVEREQVDFIDATPSTWRLLLAAGWPGRPDLRAICTGEPLPPDLARELLPRVGELWNGYGPTETTVWSSFQRVLQADGPVPIGHPIANTQIHVVDAQLRTLPVGVIGELYIGGEGVTSGYHGRPDLTAERFLPDPHRPGHAWYKTGDLGRWRADGVLECLGRSDHQVKVRGYRIELGEIEATLARHDTVARTVVITREDEPGDVRLVAYVVPVVETIDAGVLREFLRRSLPEYMLPAHMVALPAIPLLPNGKIDRKALPRPQADAAAAGGGRQAPRNPLEQQVLAAMEQILNLPALGTTDDFFQLGGHSLLAAKLTARLNKALSLALPLRTVFEQPTVQGLAQAIEALQRQGGAMPRPGITRQASGVDAPLTMMQERIRFMEELQPGRVTYNTPSAHRLRGPMDVAAFERALQAMAQRQPSLRTCIAHDGARPMQRVVPEARFDLVLEDLSMVPEHAREHDLMRRLQAEVDRPLDLQKAPLVRTVLFRLAEEEHVFLFMPHHIVWDGWSFDLLYQELAALLPATLAGQDSPLPELPVTYNDYAHWHAQWMQGPECEAQVQFWKRRYQGISVPRALPTDHPRRAGMTGAGAVEWVQVDKALTERLREIARDAGGTLNMLVMAVYAAMMGQALSSPSLVMGVPVRGRLLPEVESVMGFFNNLLPAHLQVDAALPLPAWIARVKAELLDVFAHQDVPFERLVIEPEIAQHAHRVGLYQTLFSFQDARERERRWGPLAHSSVLVMQKGATEDFGLWLMEVPAGLEGGINYNADLFDAATARLFRDRLVGLLRRVAEQPVQTVEALLAAPGHEVEAFAAWIRRHADPAPPAVSPGPAPAAAPLPVLAAPTAAAPQAPVAAQDAQSVQQHLAQIWADLLGMPADEISGRDSFFDLGGNSLLAMQAAQEVHKQLGKRVPANAFVMESLAQLAQTVLASASVAPTADPAAVAPTTPAPAAVPAEEGGGLFKRLGSVLRR